VFSAAKLMSFPERSKKGSNEPPRPGIRLCLFQHNCCPGHPSFEKEGKFKNIPFSSNIQIYREIGI
jgi:hypothetical protein